MTKKKLLVTSNVKNRMKKIRGGVVYNDIYAVIDEVIIQNPKRAEATKVYITIQDDTIIISDNGKGCAVPEVLFTLDFSGFGTGFGEGFTSIYMIADFFEVRTLGWKGSLNIKEVLDENKGELAVQISDALLYKDGFELELKGEKIQEFSYEFTDYIKRAAAIVPDMDFILNGEQVQKQDIFNISETSSYTKEFHNRKYKGKLSLTHRYGDSIIKVYFEHRFVMEMHFDGLSGSILLEPNAVNLRTPDRRGIIYDSKEKKLMKQLEKDVKHLLTEMISKGDGDEIKLFSNMVDYHMTVNEYINCLTIDSGKILNQYEMREKNHEKKSISSPVVETPDLMQMAAFIEENCVTEANVHTAITHADSFALGADTQVSFSFTDSSTQGAEVAHTSIPVPEESQLEQSGSVAVAVMEEPKEETPVLQQKEEDNKQEPVDTKRSKEDKTMTSYVKQGVKKESSLVKKDDMDKLSIKNIKSKKNVIWVQNSLVDEYASLISQYEYYGIYTFKSPHILYDNALKHLGIPHVSSLEHEALKKDYKVTKTGARSKKEERVMKILGFIERLFGLGQTFYISDIQCTLTVQLRGTKIYKQKLNIEGYAQGYEIHLNRKDLDFGGITSTQLDKETFGIHDIKFVLANLDVIAHELAHVIYDTEDNTKNHFEKQIEIQNAISKAITDTSARLW